jgi:hypothetical protein
VYWHGVWRRVISRHYREQLTWEVRSPARLWVYSWVCWPEGSRTNCDETNSCQCRGPSHHTRVSDTWVPASVLGFVCGQHADTQTDCEYCKRPGSACIMVHKMVDERVFFILSSGLVDILHFMKKRLLQFLHDRRYRHQLYNDGPHSYFIQPNALQSTRVRLSVLGLLGKSIS